MIIIAASTLTFMVPPKSKTYTLFITKLTQFLHTFKGNLVISSSHNLIPDEQASLVAPYSPAKAGYRFKILITLLNNFIRDETCLIFTHLEVPHVQYRLTPDIRNEFSLRSLFFKSLRYESPIYIFHIR